LLALLTQREAAELLRLHEFTLMRLRISGGGPKYIRFGKTRAVRYRPADLEAWLATKLVGSTSEEPELPRPRRAPIRKIPDVASEPHQKGADD
jgi:hypothetical protein